MLYSSLAFITNISFITYISLLSLLGTLLFIVPVIYLFNTQHTANILYRHKELISYTIIFSDVIRSFMWLNYRYRYLPEPSIIGPSITASSGFQQLWGDLLTQETAGAFT